MYSPGPRSAELWRRARAVIPGGVNSPVRAFGAVGGQPVFARSGSGCRLRDVDGREYIDYVMSWGPLILGHACLRVVEAVRRACAAGMSFGMPTAAECRLAELVAECVPSIEKLRMVSSGTEAVMSAIRLARGCTGRDLVVKCEGCYHGHVDSLLAAAGSGVTTFAIPDTAGVPAGFTGQTLLVPYNDAAAVRRAFAEFGDDIACVIVEPVAGNMGVVPPRPGYLKELRELTRARSSLLVFDEVITGFRVALGGAQELYGVVPDLTVLGKILGGGMPAAAYGGAGQLMDELAPAGSVYQAGTLSGNPAATAAGIATLETLIEDPPYPRLDRLAANLEAGLRQAANDAGVRVFQNRVGSMQTLFFAPGPVSDYATAKAADTGMYGAFFHRMLAEGIHFAPSQFEACFVSTAHRETDIAATVAAAERIFGDLA